MIDRRRAIRLAVAAAALLVVWELPLSVAHAQQSFRRFLPLLIDLPGWTGEKPDGMAMDKRRAVLDLARPPLFRNCRLDGLPIETLGQRQGFVLGNAVE